MGRGAVPLVAWLAAVTMAGGIAQAGGEDEAKIQYKKGTAAYEEGHFDEAVAAFTRAHELDPAPILLFNIAQAHWKKGDNQQALVFYRRYLDADPAGAERPRVEARIRELEASAAPARRVLAAPAEVAPSRLNIEAPRADPLPQAVEERSLYRKPWFWAAVAGVVAGAVTVTLAARGGGGHAWECGTRCGFGTIAVKGDQ
jgi:tetratricopeptide (TPR) repeat protein